MLLWQWFKTIYLFTAPEQFDLPFDPDCSDDFVNDDNAMLILEQARERLANTLKNSDSLDLKTNVFFPVLIALITALIGYLSALYKPNLPIWEQGWNLITPTLSLVLGFLISVIPLMQNLMPMFYEQTGKSPKNLAIDSVLQLEKKHLLFREALSYENRILNNDALNKVKAKRINICVQSIIITLIFSFVIIIVFMPLQLLLKLLIMIDIQKIISSLDLYHHF